MNKAPYDIDKSSIELPQEVEATTQTGLTEVIAKRSSRIWYHYAESYLRASLAIVESDLAGIVPLLYNIRHSLELVIKYVIWSDQRDKDSEKHDWGKLSDKFDQDLDGLYEKAGEETKNAVGENFSEQKEKVIDLMSKYYYYEVLKEKFLDLVKIQDPCAELFKYPDHNKIELLVSNPSEYSINNSKKEEISQDINSILSFLKKIQTLRGDE